jgi:hypothetical protein
MTRLEVVTPQIKTHDNREYDAPTTEAQRLCEQHGIEYDYLPAVEELIDCGVLGAKARKAGWENVGLHCITAFKEARVHMYLLGTPDGDALWFNAMTLLHDKDLRREKEGYAVSADDHYGIQRLQVSQQFYFEHEMMHSGILRVTGLDWRDFESYSLEEAAMRYIDSTVGPCKNPDGTFGRDSIQHYKERHAALHKRKPEISQEVGKMFYGGVPAFVYLNTILPILENRLYEQAKQMHPEYFTDGTYSHSSDYFNLVRDLMWLQEAQGQELHVM